ncbi:MAG: YdcF family protein [Eubacteriales bacterium]
MFKKIFYIALIIIGVLGIIDTIFVSRINISLTVGTVAPAVIGVLFIIYAALKLRLKGGHIITHNGFRIFVIVSFCIFFAIFAVIEGILLANAYSHQHEKVETNFVVVLGCGIFPDGMLTRSLARRLNVAYDYLEQHPNTICIVSGGQGPNEPTTEAYAMKKYLIERGISADRIIEEDQSTSTNENLMFSKEIMLEYDKELTVAIATSDFHIFRAKLLAKNHGLDAIGLPSVTSWYIWINSYLREFLAVIKTLIFDL